MQSGPNKKVGLALVLGIIVVGVLIFFLVPFFADSNYFRGCAKR